MGKINCMVDTETLGTYFDSVICSIGAVKFDVEGNVDQNFIDEFYVTIDAKDSVDHGLRIEQSTLDWWALQDQEAFKALRKNNIPLKDALVKFTEWFGSKSMPTWSCGSDFDNVLLESAYRAVNLKRPFTPWDSRCYRTMKNIFPIKPPKREGTHHNSLDDAKFQARHLLTIFKS
jgi:hypothetical protein